MIERLFSEAWQEVRKEIDLIEHQIQTFQPGCERLSLDVLRKKIKFVLLESLKRHLHKHIKEKYNGRGV